MSKQENPVDERQPMLTQHAMLVVWGLFAQRIGLVEKISQIELGQKKRDHRPQTKVLEFLVAILAGLPYLKDISQAAHPLDQDEAVAEAWDQPGWADHSGVSRPLQSLTQEEVDEVVAVLAEVEQPFVAQETEQALAQSGRLVYDADLTGRLVSSTSTTYPDTAFGYMGDTIGLGYQAALVSLHSPTYGRLWLASQLHPGDTVSSTQAQALVAAAEQRTGLRPRRRTELVAERLASAHQEQRQAAEQVEQSEEKLHAAQAKAADVGIELRHWRQEVANLEAAYRRQKRQPTPYCQLSRARAKVTTYQNRLPRLQQAVGVAERRLARHLRTLDQATQCVTHLHQRHAQLQAENAANPHPIRALFRLDSGFASQENLAWLIEMGYAVYTKARSPKVRETLKAAAPAEAEWQPVGGNARLTAWPATTVEGAFIYPLNVALAQYQTGETVRHAVLLHYGEEAVTEDLAGWFATYNGRQTIEAGIKEGKSVFQMHHLKVRSAQALRLQEQFAAFAANFVRFAAPWLSQQHKAAQVTTSVKQLVQVCAHTSAWVLRQADVWLITFTAHSCYAGLSLRIGIGVLQLPLPLFQDVHFAHF